MKDFGRRKGERFCGWEVFILWRFNHRAAECAARKKLRRLRRLEQRSRK